MTAVSSLDPYYKDIIERLQRAKNVHALDIETETKGERFKYRNGSESNHPVGLDPRVSSITTIGVAGTNDATFQVDGADEASMLQALYGYLGFLNGEDALIGWNSNYFDVPFIYVREKALQGRFLQMSKNSGDIRFWQSPRDSIVGPKYGPSEWFDLINRKEWCGAAIQGRDVLDIAPVWKPFCEKFGVKHSLKPLCTFLGIPMIEVDASKMYDLTPAERRAYNLSDARGTAILGRMTTYIDDLYEKFRPA